MRFATRKAVHGLVKLAIASVVVITALSSLAIFLVPPSPQERMIRRQVQAQRLVDEITQAVWTYQHEHGDFPPGEGFGTASLVRALETPSGSGLPYMTFVQEMLTPEGNLRNPVSPESEVLFYRNNRGGGAPDPQVPPPHNKGSFDLWGKGSTGGAKGINNWDSVVASP